MITTEDTWSSLQLDFFFCSYSNSFAPFRVTDFASLLTVKIKMNFFR